MKFDDGLSARLLRLVAFQGNVGLWNAVLEELRPAKASPCQHQGLRDLLGIATAPPFTG